MTRVHPRDLETFRRRIARLRDQGLSTIAIGRIVGRTANTVAYHLSEMDYVSTAGRAQYLVHRGAGL